MTLKVKKILNKLIKKNNSIKLNLRFQFCKNVIKYIYSRGNIKITPTFSN